MTTPEVVTDPTALAEYEALLTDAAYRRLRPPPRRPLSDWADQERFLSSEASSEPGRWRTSRAPYAREVLDAIGDPLIEHVVLMWAAQTSKSEMLLNAIGQTAADDPCPMMLVCPTGRLGESMSKDRIAPMIRDTPALQGVFADPGAKTPGNTLTHKTFPGGFLFIAGANSPSDLASRPCRKIWMDEVDRFPASAGTEGDPVTLATKRSMTFPLRKILLASTPTIKGESRIEEAFLESDQRYYHVACTKCGEFQRLEWKNLRYKEVTEPVYECAACAHQIEESNKYPMLVGGKWVPYAPDVLKRGYHLNALYSPWAPWPDIVAEWVGAQGNPLRIQAFVNTVLAETYEDYGERLSTDELAGRREQYEAPVPPGVVVLTAGIDVQADRIEVHTWGWGRNEESWLVGVEIVTGDVTLPQTWDALDEAVWREYATVDGEVVTPAAVAIDCGFATQSVLDWGAPRLNRGVYMVKGGSERGKPLVSRRPTKTGKGAGRVWMVGTSTSQDLAYGRLRLTEPGAGYVHVPEWADDELLAQFTAEVKKPVKEKGVWTRRWDLPRGLRCEGADCYRYGLAALSLRNFTTLSLARLADRQQVITGPTRGAVTPRQDGLPTPQPADPVKPFVKARRGRHKKPGWVKGW